MANRPTGYGFTAETTKKIDDKYDVESERQAIDWVNALLGGEEVGYGKDKVQNTLKDGIILCNIDFIGTGLGTVSLMDSLEHKVMNILQPGSIGKIHPATSNNFKQMENISNFLTAAEKYGCNRGDLFQSVYLQDGQNMAAVIGGIHALGRKAQTNGFSGPALGPKEAQGNPREFSEEQLLHGRVHGI